MSWWIFWALIVTGSSSGEQVRRVTLHLRNIQATIAFFYGRTSGGKGDAQSPANFLLRLVNEYGVLKEQEVVEALRLENLDKSSIKTSFDKATIDEDKTRELFQKLVQRLQEAKAEEADPENSWFLPYIRDKGKLLNASPEDYMDSILDGAFLCFAPLGEAERGGGLACRVCGTHIGPIGEKNILLGISVGKFHNQLGNTKKAASASICSRCALFSFLNTKLFGMTSAGKFPVPSRENLIFHYGCHDESGVRGWIDSRTRLSSWPVSSKTSGERSAKRTRNWRMRSVVYWMQSGKPISCESLLPLWRTRTLAKTSAICW